MRRIKNLIDESSPSALYSKIFIIVFISIVFWIFYPISYLSYAVPDDTWMILKNQYLGEKKFDYINLCEIFLAKNEIQYSPLNTLYYWALYIINGFDPYIYHLFSLTIHLINVYLVYVLSFNLLRTFGIKNYKTISIITAGIWCIHPLNVEAIVWISASKILLFSFFTFLSLISFLKGSNKKIQYYFISIVFFLLACFCKEQAFILPITFGSLLYFIPSYRTRLSYLFFFATLIILIFFGVLALNYNLVNNGYVLPMLDYSPIERVVLSFYCLSFYFTNLIIPLNLHYHYPYPFSPSDDIPLSMYIYPLMFITFFCLLMYNLIKNRNKKFYLFSLLFFFSQILLVLQIIPLTRPAIMADRYMYIPLIPLLWIMINLLVNNIKLDRLNLGIRIIIINLLTGYVIYFIIYSNQLVRNWEFLNLIAHEQK